LYHFHLSGLEGCSLPQSRSYWTKLGYHLGVFVFFLAFLSLLLWLCLWLCFTLSFRTVCCCCCLRTLYPLITTSFAPHIFVFHWCDFVRIHNSSVFNLIYHLSEENFWEPSVTLFSWIIIVWCFDYNHAAILHFQVMFQYSVRHSPLRFDDLLGSVSSPADQESRACDIEMDGW